MAPPLIRIVAASGTVRTMKPSCWRSDCKTAKAVVFPAQGPPVMQILWRLTLVLWWSSSCLIDF